MTTRGIYAIISKKGEEEMIGKQLHTTSAKVLIEEVKPVVNSEECAVVIKKPGRGTGLWTSTWDEETKESGWIEWCQGNSYGSPEKENWFLLTPKPDVRLYTIDSYGDLITMLARFEWHTPFIQEMNARYDATRDQEYAALCGIAPTKTKPFIAIDFERMALEFDGIHLTERGNAQTHLSYPYDLYAWDCESTLWFRWKFECVEQIASVRA